MTKAVAARAKHSSAPCAVELAEEGALWRRWWDGGDAAARHALVVRYSPYAKSLAARLFARRPFPEVPFDDFHQLAMVGLLEAVDRYAPNRGASFKTFATIRIRGAVLNGLERVTERHQQAAMRRRLAAERSASLLPETLTTAPDRLLEDLGDIGMNVALSLILEGCGMGAVRQEALRDHAYAQLELGDMRRHVRAMVALLPDRERGIIEMHYERSLRFEEIARVMKVTKGRVSQLHRQAVERLRILVSKAGECDVVF